MYVNEVIWSYTIKENVFDIQGRSEYSYLYMPQYFLPR